MTPQPSSREFFEGMLAAGKADAPTYLGLARLAQHARPPSGTGSARAGAGPRTAQPRRPDLKADQLARSATTAPLRRFTGRGESCPGLAPKCGGPT